MASIYRNGSKWRAQVCKAGVRDSESFDTRAQAAQWALRREAELSGRQLSDKSLTDAMKGYARDVAPTHRGSRWELVRLKALGKDRLAKRKLAGLTGEDFDTWRDLRLRQVKPGSVAREMNLLRSVLEYARRAPRKWLVINPMDGIAWPKTPPGRKRRVPADEVKTIMVAFGLANGLRARTLTQRVGLAFLFALETAMRAGEILELEPGRIYLADRYVRLDMTKNGEGRDVPLTRAAVDILKALEPWEACKPVFGLASGQRDALWRKNRPAALRDLHFHDSRAEAIWRLSKKLDVLQLARVVGHNDIKSLLIYYQPTASELAAQLG